MDSLLQKAYDTHHCVIMSYQSEYFIQKIKVRLVWVSVLQVKETTLKQ